MNAPRHTYNDLLYGWTLVARPMGSCWWTDRRIEQTDGITGQADTQFDRRPVVRMDGQMGRTDGRSDEIAGGLVDR